MGGKKGSGSGTGGKSSLASSIAGALFKPNKWVLLTQAKQSGDSFQEWCETVFCLHSPHQVPGNSHIWKENCWLQGGETGLPSQLISDCTQAPGYGTSWGTSFANGAGQYKSKSGFSKKALGLGVGAGFLGGAGLGVAGTLASYSVYHRYQVPDEGC